MDDARIDLGGGGWIVYRPRFVEAPDAAMEALLSELPLCQETVHIAGRTFPTPRLTSWHGDPGCVYSYSGRRFEPAPWTPGLSALLDALTPACGVRFNSVLANHYRDGRDSMGAHSDDEPELGPSRDDVRIASVSLGSPRRFVLKHRQRDDRHEWSLGGGSLLLMGGALQRHYKHHVPKTARPVGPRLNLTFRFITQPALGGRGDARRAPPL